MKKYKIRKPGGFAALFLLAASLMLAPVLSACKQTVDGGTSASKEKPSVPPAAAKITLTMQKGRYIQSIEPQSMSVDKGSKWGDIAGKMSVTCEDGYKIAGWKLNGEDGTDLSDEYVFDKNAVVYAAAQAVPPPDSGGQPVTITIRGDERIDISVPDSISVKPNQTWKAVKERIASKAALKSGWDQAEYGIYEWRLNDEDGKILTDDYVFTQSETVYAVTNYTQFKTEGSKLIGYAGKKPRGKIVIPAKINGSTITEIGEEAFKDCSGITEVDISACTQLAIIGYAVFFRCTKLEKVKLPASLREIRGSGQWGGAFEDCTNLTKINLFDCTQLTKIGERSFFRCMGLSGTLSLPAQLTVLKRDAFTQCKGITEIDFSACKQLTKIDMTAFSSCKNLKHVRFPVQLTTIEPLVFSGCTGLTEVTFPGTLVKIQDSAFRNCSGVTVFDLSQCPKSLEFGTEVFWGCMQARFKIKRGSPIKKLLLGNDIDSGKKIRKSQIEEVD